MMAFFKKITGANDPFESGKNKPDNDTLVLDENEVLVVDDNTAYAVEAETNDPETLSEILNRAEDDSADESAGDESQTSLGDFNALRESLASYNPPKFTADLDKAAPNVDVTPLREAVSSIDEVAEDSQKLEDTEFEGNGDYDVDDYEVDYDAIDPENLREPVITRRTNLSDLRLDVTRISSDIENGEALYRRAQQRVDSLMHFIESAEVDFSLLNRLEPENRRLKAQNRTLSSEVENQNHKVSVLQADLEDHQRRLVESKNQLDAANARLAKVTSGLQDSEKDLKRTTLDLDAMSLKYERQKTTLELESTENANLREKVTALSGALDDANNEKMIYAKKVESLKIDCDDQRNIKDTLQNEIYELRNALEMSKKQNAEMRGQLQSVQEDIKSFKTQYEFNLISRDDRIAVLDSEVDSLTNQLKIKDEIASEAVRDLNELRKARTAGELETHRLEKTNINLTNQLEEVQRELLVTRQEANRYEQRFHEASAALEMSNQREAEAEPKQQAKAEPRPETPPATSQERSQESSRRDYARATTPIQVRPAASTARPPATQAKPDTAPRKDEPAAASAPNAETPRVMPKLAAVTPPPESRQQQAPRPEPQPAPAAAIKAVDDPDDDEITEDEINDMITEFKLGIRSKIG